MNTGGLAQTNAYMIVDEAAVTESGRGIAAIIDAPQATTESFLGQAKQHGWDVRYLLLTHGHWDHISDHQVVTDAFPNARVLIHRLDEPKLKNPGGGGIELPYTIPARGADGYLEDGDKIHVGSISLAVMHTPGHTPGHVVFYSNDLGVLFAGDLLMAGAVGRYDFADGSPEQLKKSLGRMMLLPDAVRVLSGHGPATTIGHERATNPFIREWQLGEGQ
jgi:glyoxylase-like metal-dependent hydrolase (beta-lactamase superfamily II)